MHTTLVRFILNPLNLREPEHTPEALTSAISLRPSLI